MQWKGWISVELDKQNIDTGQNEAMQSLPLKRKLAFAMGDIGNNFSWTFVSSYLMYFWTDVLGVSTGFSGTIMLISRFWDAVNDPIIGTMADRTRSRWGCYRPWILLAAVPLAIVNILAFTAFPIASQTGRNLYALFSFFLLVFVFTCVNIPYTALQAATTLNTEERSKQASFRLIGSYIGMLFVSNMTLRFVGWFGNGDDGRGYLLTAVLYSFVFMLPCLLVCFLGTREVCKPPKAEKVSLKTSLRAIRGNTPVLILSVGFLAYGLYSYGRSAVAMYYFTYNAGNKLLFATYSLFNYGGCLLGALIMPLFSKRLKNKATVPKVGYAIVAVALLCMGLFVDPTQSSGIHMLYGLQLIASTAQGMSVSGLYSMIPDTTEYTQLKHGIRASGFISAMTSFAMKLGMGIGTASVGWTLEWFGYVAGAQQSSSALACINTIFTFIPAGFSIIVTVLLFFYKLDKASYNAMVHDLGLD